MIKPWIPPSLICLFFYGLWGVFGAKASHLANAKTVFLLSCIGSMLVALIMIPLTTSSRIHFGFQGFSFSLLSGLTTGLGTLMFIYALQRGPTIPIVMITALYPLVTVFLSMLFLNQAISFKQWIGIALSMLAIYCLTTS